MARSSLPPRTPSLTQYNEYCMSHGRMHVDRAQVCEQVVISTHACAPTLIAALAQLFTASCNTAPPSASSASSSPFLQGNHRQSECDTPYAYDGDDGDRIGSMSGLAECHACLDDHRMFVPSRSSTGRAARPACKPSARLTCTMRRVC